MPGPGFLLVPQAGSVTMNASKATVEVNGQAWDALYCTAIEQSAGALPSKALLRIGRGDLSLIGPITLNRYDFSGFLPFARIRISVDGSETLFLGNLGRRKDQGLTDHITWWAYDDRLLLQFLPLRGCVVLDAEDDTDGSDGTVKFINGYDFRCNPGGFWNGVWAKVRVSGADGIWPVFSRSAGRGQNYTSPDFTFDPTPVEGKAFPWTPRLMLQHLLLRAYLDYGDIPGIAKLENNTSWRNIKKSKRIGWDVSSINGLHGGDPLAAIDPLDKKLADITFQGMSMLLGIETVLTAAGTHGLCLRYVNQQDDTVKSQVTFYDKSVFNRGTGGAATVIPLQRGGEVSNINTGYDFDLDEDSTKIGEAVLVEGHRRMVETSLIYEGNPASDTLAPAWSKQEEDAFVRALAGDGTYVYFGSVVNDLNPGFSADGIAPRPLGQRGQPNGINLVRLSYPKVFRAFRLVSENLFIQGPLAGRGSKTLNDFSNITKYPFLHGERSISAAQLQFYLLKASGGENAADGAFGDITNRLLINLPIRIQVQSTKGGVAPLNTSYREVTSIPGVRITDDGLIWFDGLVENIDGSADCIYNPALGNVDGPTTTPANVPILRKIKMNCAFPLDHRLPGYAEVGAIGPDKTTQRLLDPQIYSDLGGPPILYVDSPGAYHEFMQCNSEPFPVGSSVNYVNSGTTAPLTRFIPPGSEATFAQFAANRRLAGSQFPIRFSQWSMIGIRPEYVVGLWIDRVKVYGGVAADTDYLISAPVENILFDFENQITIVGGLISSLRSGMERGLRGGENVNAISNVIPGTLAAARQAAGVGGGNAGFGEGGGGGGNPGIGQFSKSIGLPGGGGPGMPGGGGGGGGLAFPDPLAGGGGKFAGGSREGVPGGAKALPLGAFTKGKGITITSPSQVTRPEGE